MATDAVDEQYFTYEARLASFQKTTKKRGSTTKGSKALNWPHKKIAPESLARAGFFFQPFPDNPDNVVCFLCQKNMDGWEDGDDPLQEHLKHSSACGWAITAAIEAEIAEYAQANPNEASMVEARKATFAGRWPHDGKRGWKCKTKQLVDSGWKYTPTPDSDDNATCTYCGLGLDGWEPSDKPYDEHHKRSPNCSFFALVEQYAATKKTGRTKAARGSKASRLSTQSVATFTSEAPSVADITATTNADDTVLTTASTMTQGAKKGRAKKATTAKGRKPRAKKEEPVVEVEQVEEAKAPEPEAESQPEPQPEEADESQAAPPPKKATRGKKRRSGEMDESTLTVPEAPARKKRATKGRGSTAVESSVLEPTMEHTVDEEMSDAPPAKKTAGRKKGRAASKTRAPRKVSGKVNASIISSSPPKAPSDFPDDDEIERQLEADLDRFSDDEDIAADSDSERFKAKAKATKGKKATEHSKPHQKSADYAMLDPTPAEPDDGEVEDELNALRAEMEVKAQEPEPEPEPVQEPEPDTLQVPKKGRKAGTRKVSKQTKSKKAQQAEVPPPEPEEELVHEVPAPEEPLQDQQDASWGSTDTVVKTSEPEQVEDEKIHEKPSKASRPSHSPTEADELADEPIAPVEQPKKRGRGRPSKASMESAESMDLVEKPVEEVVQETQPPKKRGRGRPSKATSEAASAVASLAKPADPPVKRGRGRPPKKSSVESKSFDVEAQLQQEAIDAEMRAQLEAAQEPEVLDEEQPSSPMRDSSEAPPSDPPRQISQAPSTPGKGISPSASARQPALSPSHSPQSSDAENRPPSSRPATSVTTTRIALAPVAATPVRSSPSKRNMLAGLQSKTPWKPMDLDTVLGTPLAGADKENGVDRLLRKGKELSSPEKGMTVEEWIYFNAGEAEKLLKQECETMVSRFESEGTKAMNVLEELVAE